MSLKTKGYICGMIAAATYGMNPLFALPLYADGMDANSVLFFRYLFAILILGIMVKLRGHNFTIKKKEIVPLIVMGLLVSASSQTLFLSYNYMAAGIASTLLFVYPILVALIMVFFFKEKLTLQTVMCIALALGGIGLLYKNENGETLNTIGVIMIFISAISYAIYIVGANRPILKNLPTVKMTFYVLLFGMSIYIVATKGCTEISSPTHWYLWLNLLALAFLPTAVSFLCTTLAVQYIGSTPTAILGALEPVVAVFIGVTLFSEPISPRIVTGIFMIILAVSLVILGGNITVALVRFRKLFPMIKRPWKYMKRKNLNS